MATKVKEKRESGIIKRLTADCGEDQDLIEETIKDALMDATLGLIIDMETGGAGTKDGYQEQVSARLFVDEFASVEAIAKLARDTRNSVINRVLKVGIKTLEDQMSKPMKKDYEKEKSDILIDLMKKRASEE